MDLDKVENEFQLITPSLQQMKGRRLLNKVNFLLEERKFTDVIINGRVESENSNATYTTLININNDTNSINDTKCNCIDFMQNNIFTRRYVCKHIAATFLKYVRDNQGLKVGDGQGLIEAFEQLNIPKDTLEILVSLNQSEKEGKPYWIANFKIGSDKSYIVKDIKAFIDAKNNCGEIAYGKNFVYTPFDQEVNEKDNKIVDYMERIIELDEFTSNFYGSDRLVKGKNLFITEKSLRYFLTICKHRNIEFEKKIVSIIEDDIPLNFKLKKDDKDEYVLDINDMNLNVLTSQFNVFLYKENIYLPSIKQCQYIKAVYSNLDREKKIKFRGKNKKDVFNKVVPTLNNISNNIDIDSKIDNVVKEPLKANFYIDSKANKILLDVKFNYGNEKVSFFDDNSEKIIIRDSKKEQEIMNTITDMDFEVRNNKFIFAGDEDKLYEFLTQSYKKLDELGDVYYSDRFKSKKVYYMPVINASIKDRGDGFLDFTFDIENIDKREYKKIIEAIREHRRYYKLKDNSFINLEDKNTKSFLEIVDNISNNEKDITNFKIHRSKALIMQDYIERENIEFIKGTDVVKSIVDKINDANNKVYEVPKSLRNVLREYQVTGFNWFKNLSYLGLGGILADEMGLGKTLQTIAFLLSEVEKKSLIVAPTSLIYNWKNEFEKFAPELKIAIVHGTKHERIKVIKDNPDFDVILTTYGTLRNDEDIYNDIVFDYCIIDEGQNIKNPLALSSRSVKNIKAKARFALTGTPIENNLLELWSIFDFIMPGYLYGSRKFKSKFIDSNDVNSLQKFIRPFLLRRLKKDVIKELPEKIEKKYYVELPKEQKKIYGVFVKDIKRKMEAKNYSEDKITIFSYLTKLRQLCLEPSLVVNDYEGKNGKLDMVTELVQNNLENGHKIILFSQFTSVLSVISNRFDREGIKYMYLDGSTKASTRVKLVDEFNECEENIVFLISLKAGGTGLNLTSADVVIHFDPWWNPSIEEQATDRAHRIGQKNVVQVFKLIAEGTIEEKIINLQEDKRKLVENVMNVGYEKGNVLSGLTIDEIKLLFE